MQIKMDFFVKNRMNSIILSDLSTFLIQNARQKVYIRSIYSNWCLFAKNRVVSLGYPLAMFGVTLGAGSSWTRKGVEAGLC